MATTTAQKSTSGDAKLLNRADSLVRWSTWEAKTHTHMSSISVLCCAAGITFGGGWWFHVLTSQGPRVLR